MRTDKIGFGSYLHSINRAETNQCSCNHGEQTVEYVSLKYRKWMAERKEMWAGRRSILSLRGLLNNSKIEVRAARMMLKSGLVEQYKHVSLEQPRPHPQHQP